MLLPHQILKVLNALSARYDKAIEDQSEADRLRNTRSGRTISEYRVSG